VQVSKLCIRMSTNISVPSNPWKFTPTKVKSCDRIKIMYWNVNEHFSSFKSMQIDTNESEVLWQDKIMYWNVSEHLGSFKSMKIDTNKNKWNHRIKHVEIYSSNYFFCTTIYLFTMSWLSIMFILMQHYMWHQFWLHCPQIYLLKTLMCTVI
jgi:hypothetical protein